LPQRKAWNKKHESKTITKNHSTEKIQNWNSTIWQPPSKATSQSSQTSRRPLPTKQAI